MGIVEEVQEAFDRMEDAEVRLGTREPGDLTRLKGKCKDGGTCHHNCKEGECYREQSCVPLSDSGYDDNWNKI